MTPAHTAGVLHTDATGWRLAAGSVTVANFSSTATGPQYVAEAAANCERARICWNALCGLDNDAVERLGVYLQGMNSDQVRDLLADG